MKEVEAKAWLNKRAEAVIQAFLEQSAQKEGSTEKRDRYFAHESESKGTFRIRQETTMGEVSSSTKEGVVTQKVRGYSERGVEINEEKEFIVSDTEALEAMLAKCGCTFLREKRKRVEKYRMGILLLEKVEISELGKFLEAEAMVEDEKDISETEEQIFSLFKKLGLESSIEKRPYLQLLEETASHL